MRPAGPARAALLAVLPSMAVASVAHLAQAAGIDEARARTTLVNLRRTGAVRQISSFAACAHASPTSAPGATTHPRGRGCPPKLYTLAAQAANEPRFDAAAYLRAVWR
jgi:predicted ArsR family transcriptional regulator